MTLTEMQAKLAELNAQIAAATKAETIMVKLQKTRLNHQTAHKYFDLQKAYVEACQNKVN